MLSYSIKKKKKKNGNSISVDITDDTIRTMLVSAQFGLFDIAG